MHQSLTTRVGDLSRDRIEFRRAVRELAEGMRKPTERVLKWVAGYLVAKLRVVEVIPRQDIFIHITTFCGTGYAVYAQTRQATMGVALTAGTALVRAPPVGTRHSTDRLRCEGVIGREGPRPRIGAYSSEPIS